MRCRYVLGAALLFAGTASAEIDRTEPPDVEIDGEHTTEIIGGTRTTVGQYPTVVAVTAGGGICTGTIVHADWVLTAAHCVSPSVLGGTQQQITDSVRIYFNTVDINTTAGRANVRRASMTIPKPSFNINSLGANDIGLIKVSQPFPDTIVPSPVNFDAAMAPVGVEVTMVGFGTTTVGAGGSTGIQFALTSRTSTSCSTFGIGSNTNLLCFNQQDNKGKCQGDSGGPSFAMINGKLAVVGVTSFGDQQCAAFGADTRTDIEKDFLLMHAPQLEAKCTMDSECPNMGVCFNSQCIAQPFTGNGLGATCTSGAGCESGICADGEGGMKCTMLCTPGAADACPSGFECLDTGGGVGACWPESEGGGCCDASGNGAPTALFGLLLFGLVLRRRR